MKIKKKSIILIGIILILIIFINSKCYAALQANGAAGTQKYLHDWIIDIRKMEALGGGMGLTETINEKLIPNTPSNNLDVHMEKNTEYGAMAILSASSYGNPNVIPNGGTTTGNKTGIVININRELVVAVSVKQNSGTVNIRNAANKYKNIYDDNNREISPIFKGDAMSETKGWHGSVSRTSFGDAQLVRGFQNSIFGYHAFHDSTGHNAWQNTRTALYSRAAMVCGEGI